MQPARSSSVPSHDARAVTRRVNPPSPGSLASRGQNGRPLWPPVRLQSKAGVGHKILRMGANCDAKGRVNAERIDLAVARGVVRASHPCNCTSPPPAATMFSPAQAIIPGSVSQPMAHQPGLEKSARPGVSLSTTRVEKVSPGCGVHKTMAAATAALSAPSHHTPARLAPKEAVVRAGSTPPTRLSPAGPDAGVSLRLPARPSPVASPGGSPVD
jgi:hypothetical protein